MAKAAKLPKPQSPKAKAPSSSGPKMGKAGNSNTPKAASAPKQLEFKPDLKSKQYRALGNVNRANPPEKINLPDRNPFSSKLKPQAAPSTAKPEGTGRFTDKLAKNRGTPKAPKDLGIGKNPMAPRAAATAAKAESTAAKAVRVASPYLKTVGKVMGRANIAVDMIANAQPTNQGESEWLKNKGPLMKGNKVAGSEMRKPAGTYTKSYDKTPSEYSGYGTFNKPLPKAPSGSGMSFGNTPLPSNKAPSTSPAAPSSPGPSFSKGSTKPPAYQAPVAGPKRGSVDTRYNRDSGLAMDARKRK